MDEIVEGGSFLFDYPLWYISTTSKLVSEGVITGFTGTGDRYAYVFTDEGFARRFLEELPQLSHCQPTPLKTPDEFVIFLDLMEAANCTYVGIDGRLSGTRCYGIREVRRRTTRRYVEA